MAPEGLAQFNQDGSTVVMIGAEHSPGMESMTGSLAQALSQAAGVALARKLRGDTGRGGVLMSGGVVQEGQRRVSFLALADHRMDNVGIYGDVNGQQCDGRVQDVMGIEPLADKLAAFGADVVRVDGHDVEALAAAGRGPWQQGKPRVVLCY